jgi:hypothetical protein
MAYLRANGVNKIAKQKLAEIRELFPERLYRMLRKKRIIMFLVG